jgi:predicted DNA-binding mobile mystery protein A
MKKLKQNQIDRYLAGFAPLKQFPTPKQGWVKYIRNALGMTSDQLAKRLNISRRRVVMIEQAEVQDSTTLKTLKEVATAMDCRMVYAFIPNTSISQILEEQARKFVMKHLKEVSHHMDLEAQSVKDKQAIEAQIEDLIEQYLSKSLKTIWDE